MRTRTPAKRTALGDHPSPKTAIPTLLSVQARPMQRTCPTLTNEQSLHAHVGSSRSFPSRPKRPMNPPKHCKYSVKQGITSRDASAFVVPTAAPKPCIARRRRPWITPQVLVQDSPFRHPTTSRLSNGHLSVALSGHPQFREVEACTGNMLCSLPLRRRCEQTHRTRQKEKPAHHVRALSAGFLLKPRKLVSNGT